MKLKWTRFALNDLKNLHDYVAEENPQAARQLISRIQITAGKLSAYPGMGRYGRLPDTRELVIASTPYIVIYQVEKELIQIVAVIHSAMRWPDY